MYGRRLKAPDKKHIEISGIHRKAVIKTKSLQIMKRSLYKNFLICKLMQGKLYKK